MSTSSTKADQNHSGKTYRNIFAYVSFVLRFACTAIDLAINATCPGGSMQTKHFIHDVKQLCHSGFRQMETWLRSNRQSGVHNSMARGDNGWWRQTGSNRRPEACKATALPTELCPQLDFIQLVRLRQGSGATACTACQDEAAEQRRLVGLGGLEPPTSRLSSARSNQLSYRP